MKNSIILISLFLIVITSCYRTNYDKKKKVIDTAIMLPSWKDGAVKKAIIQFVNEVTKETSPHYVQPQNRIATFDQDGTLWCEKPIPQLKFVAYQIKKMAESRPEWKVQQPYKAILEGNKDSLKQHEGELIHLTHSGMTLDRFNAEVEEFMASAVHPKYKKKYTNMVYQPMIELLEYLRDNGFKTYICSGGGNDFMRVFAEDIYGIAPENVIGSFSMNSFEKMDNSWKIVKKMDNFFMNNGVTKPSTINQRIGQIPIFAAGNVRSGGDIGQLTYAKTNKLHNFQLLINHDDDVREFAYSEEGDVSLKAAAEQNWNVVSMKNDWLKVFSFDENK